MLSENLTKYSRTYLYSFLNKKNGNICGLQLNGETLSETTVYSVDSVGWYIPSVYCCAAVDSIVSLYVSVI